MTQARRILVVEDDHSLRETLGEVIADEGHEVRLAANGHEALELMERWDPSVVVLDLMMPRMDAFEFRDVQRRSPSADAPRILVLSAVPQLETAAADIGADAWLAKPFRLSDLTAVIDDLLDRSPV